MPDSDTDTDTGKSTSAGSGANYCSLYVSSDTHLSNSLLQKIFKKVDTCGVYNLHGMPGIIGGCVALIAVPGILVAQISGIIFTVIFALFIGYIGGFVIRLAGGKQKLIYEDSTDFILADSNVSVPVSVEAHGNLVNS